MSQSWPYYVIGIVGLTVTVFATRSSFFMLPARYQLPPWLESLMRFAPACALVAVIAPGILVPGGHVDVGWGNHQLLAAVASAGVFLRWRNMLATITVGLLVFTALRLWA